MTKSTRRVIMVMKGGSDMALDRTIDLLLRNLRTEVTRLEKELRLAQLENDGLRYQLQEKKRKEAMASGREA